MALRHNKAAGAFERQQPDGTWTAVPDSDVPDQAWRAAGRPARTPPVGGADLDAALDSLAIAVEPQAEAVEPTADPDADLIAALSTGEPALAAVTQSPAAVGVADAPQVVDSEPGDDPMVADIPGLTSLDGTKGTGGTKAVRSIILRRGRGAKNGPKMGPQGRIEVPAKAALPSGPAVEDSTASRQGKKFQSRNGTVTEGAPRQRYVNAGPPPLMEKRPLWVRDLFEAHYRSEHTLAMRKQPSGKNGTDRMKLSRQDYAIGWLTAFDKFREDPSMLRLKATGGIEADAAS